MCGAANIPGAVQLRDDLDRSPLAVETLTTRDVVTPRVEAAAERAAAPGCSVAWRLSARDADPTVICDLIAVAPCLTSDQSQWGQYPLYNSLFSEERDGGLQSR